MKKSTGFKLNRNLRAYLSDLGLSVTPTQVYTIRAIASKYQHINEIESDFEIMNTPTEEDVQSVQQEVAGQSD